MTLPHIEVGEGPPLLVVHGGPGETHHALRPHLDALPGRVVYYDQRRRSDHRQHLADIEALRASLGCTRILGFSWGALLALLHALEHPVERVVLVSLPPMHGGFSERTRSRMERSTARPEVRALRGSAFAMRVAPMFFDPTRALELMPVETDDDDARAAWSGLRGHDLRGRLRPLRRGLVIHGAEDPIPSESALETARAIGAESLVIERCGHAPFVEAAEIFRSTVARFLDGE